MKDTKIDHSLTVKTDMPGFHFYVPDYQEACFGKQGKQDKRHCACCIETSCLLDAIHLQEHPETLLRKNELFQSETIYQFDDEA